jgi:hypothetical protein
MINENGAVGGVIPGMGNQSSPPPQENLPTFQFFGSRRSFMDSKFKNGKYSASPCGI